MPPHSPSVHLVVRGNSMAVTADSLGRIAKLFVDRDDVSVEEAADHLLRFRIIVCCGPEVERSATLQAAVLTAANIANRCFPGGLRVQGASDGPVMVPWTAGRTFREAIVDVAGEACVAPGDVGWEGAVTVAFGTVDDIRRGVQATFDGWTAGVSPLEDRVRLHERDGCVLAGVAAGGLALSEVFLGNFGCAIEAGSRVTGLSLWRPDLPWNSADATGADVPLRHLLSELWFLGLGHLGQAFAWTFSMLPFPRRADVNVVAQDFDRVIAANLDTGLLSYTSDEDRLKTRVVSTFLEGRGFRPRVIERRFDEHTHPQEQEPRILLSGMDGTGPRHLLDQVGFDLVVDCGVGGTVANFDSITLNVLPNSQITAAELWPVRDEESAARRARETERLASARGVYRTVQERQGCGHVELAGRSVAVPFVGALASALAISELLRRLMGAAQFDRIRLQLQSPGELSTSTNGGRRRRLRSPFQAAVTAQPTGMCHNCFIL